MSNSKFENIWTMMRENSFQTESDISKEMICTICSKLMIKAYSASCGCRYCAICINTYLNGFLKFCPGDEIYCKDELINIEKNIQLDQAIISRISQVIVKCPEKSCPFKDELRNIENHMRLCNSRPINCPFYNVGCKDTKILQENINDHLLEEIYSHSSLMLENIDHLNNAIEYTKKDINDIKTENQDLKKEIIVLNTINERQQINNVGERNTKDIELLNEDIVAIRNENRLLRDEINELKSINAKEQKLSTELKEINEDQFQSFNFIKNSLDLVERKINDLHIQTNRKEKELNIKYDAVYQMHKVLRENTDHTITFIETQFENVETKINLLESYHCKMKFDEYLWNIDLSVEKRKMAKLAISKEIYSDPFYTHKHGYKMCLNLNPDGYGKGKGTDLSVYFCIMRGLFDDILSWPFKYDVILSLINQDNGLTHMYKTRKFSDFPNHSAWSKPTTERNVEMGFHQFIKLDLLYNSPVLYKDNRISIKCKIKPST